MLRLFGSWLLFACLSSAQSSPFLPEDLHRKLNNEISGDIAYDHLRNLTQFHAPQGETGGFWDAARWIEARAKETGLADIRTIVMPSKEPFWTARFAEAWLLVPAAAGGATEIKLASFRELATHLADFSRSASGEAELIDVGAGLAESDYSGRDVKGKIVFASGAPHAVERLAARFGAVGVLSYYSSRVVPTDYADQVQWSSIRRKAEAGEPEPTWAVMISPRVAAEIRQRMAGLRTADYFAPAHARSAAPGALRVRVKIETEFSSDSRHGIVEGYIRGTGPHAAAQQIVLTAHIQEERFSANDDRSGCANLLEIARALSRLIAEGKLPRPQRDIRFWWVDEISGPYRYLALHPKEQPNIFANINQDMVGGHPTIGGLSRVQHVTRTPWSRPTFFNDVVESVMTALYHQNNSYLAARQAGSAALGSLYSNPIFSRMGSRDRYSMELVPYFGNSDHIVFNNAWTAAVHGGVTFIQWPDEYIHSSADDIWQQDQTTLKRNAVATAALAWYMANIGPKDLSSLSGIVQHGALARIHQNIRAAAAARGDGTATDWDLDNMVEVAVEREYSALASLRTIAPEDKNVAAQVDAALERFWRSATSLSESLPKSTVTLTPPPARSGPLAAQVPTRIASTVEYLDKRDAMKPIPGLHGLMSYEALNLADGARSIRDIYRILRAQSLAAGEWYYGKVTPEVVEQLFENARAAGIVTLAPAPPPSGASRPRAKPPARRR